MDIKTCLYIGAVVNNFMFAASSPLIHVYSIQQISSQLFAVTNWIAIISSLFMNYFVQKETIRKRLEGYFIYVVMLDLLMFISISVLGLYHVEFRYIGLAILNTTTTIIWCTVMKSSINCMFSGGTLTNFQTRQNFFVSIAEVAGATLAVILQLDIVILITMQIVGQLIFGLTDYIVVRKIRNLLQ